MTPTYLTLCSSRSLCLCNGQKITYPDCRGSHTRMADMEGRLGRFGASAGPCGLGKGGWRATRGNRGRPAHIGNNRRERETEKQSPESSLSLRLASPLTTLPCFRAHLIITAVAAASLVFVFFLFLPFRCPAI
jgi:hypothetical protein